MTIVTEHSHQSETYLVHEGCNHAMLPEPPFDDKPQTANHI